MSLEKYMPAWVKRIGLVTVFLLFAAGIVFWGGFNWALEETNKEEFCISCHLEHRGVRVTMADIGYCRHCHEDTRLKIDPLDVSHEALIKANAENRSRFQDVLEYLHRDLESNSA